MQNTLTSFAECCSPSVRSPPGVPVAAMVVASPLPKAPGVFWRQVPKQLDVPAPVQHAVGEPAPVQLESGRPWHCASAVQGTGGLWKFTPGAGWPQKAQNWLVLGPLRSILSFCCCVVLSANGIGSPPMYAVAGGGQSWL